MYTGLPWWLSDKNLPVNEACTGLTFGQEDPQSRKWQPTPVFLAGKVPGKTEESDRLQPMGPQRAGHDLATEQQHIVYRNRK